MTPSNPSDLIEPPTSFVATTDLFGNSKTEAVSKKYGDESGDAEVVAQTTTSPATKGEIDPMDPNWIEKVLKKGLL